MRTGLEFLLEYEQMTSKKCTCAIDNKVLAPFWIKTSFILQTQSHMPRTSGVRLPTCMRWFTCIYT